ncbi:MAG: C10 family peptidase, partial [Candidatus Zixiibacteriota bacterium]
MWQHLLVAMLLVFVLHVVVHGSTANHEQARKVVSNWVARVASGFETRWNGAEDPRVIGVQHLGFQSDTLAYIFLVEPSGYVVVARYKEMAPIVAYSTTDQLDLNARRGWTGILRSDLLARNRYANTLLHAEAAARINGRDSKLIDKNRASWSVWSSDFEQAAALPSEDTFEEFDEGETLLKSSWHQAEPFNSLCPTGDNETQCVVGCVATAVAQVMRYWQWPPYGTGGRGYYWSGDGDASGQLLKADFSDPYDWDNILLDYTDGLTAAEDLAVAELCYEV